MNDEKQKFKDMVNTAIEGAWGICDTLNVPAHLYAATFILNRITQSLLERATDYDPSNN